jgi:hypothetical protein
LVNLVLWWSNSTLGIATARSVLDADLAPGGGYILCTAHNLQADCSVPSVEALMQAYHDFGRYS